jgi:hypothetical protein
MSHTEVCDLFNDGPCTCAREYNVRLAGADDFTPSNGVSTDIVRDATATGSVRIHIGHFGRCGELL